MSSERILRSQALARMHRSSSDQPCRFIARSSSKNAMNAEERLHKLEQDVHSQGSFPTSTSAIQDDSHQNFINLYPRLACIFSFRKSFFERRHEQGNAFQLFHIQRIRPLWRRPSLLDFPNQKLRDVSRSEQAFCERNPLSVSVLCGYVVQHGCCEEQILHHLFLCVSIFISIVLLTKPLQHFLLHLQRRCLRLRQRI